MRATCMGCNTNMPAENMPGYNVRLGEVTEAVCAECLAYYINISAPFPQGWFSLVLQKIVADQDKNNDNVVYLR